MLLALAAISMMVAAASALPTLTGRALAAQFPDLINVFITGGSVALDATAANPVQISNSVVPVTQGDATELIIA
jgi:hypothetical protein